MTIKHLSILLIGIPFALTNCKEKTNKHIAKHKLTNYILHHVCSNNGTKDCKCTKHFNLNDSNQLIHIKLEFYRSNTGHLYQRTIGVKEVDEHLTDNEYFSGCIPQDIDPLSFTPLKGWFAKDKNHAYLYRPTSSGILISKLDDADVKSFNILQGHYNYAFDKKHVYEEGSVLENINPNDLKIQTDEHGFVTKITSGKTIYKLPHSDIP